MEARFLAWNSQDWLFMALFKKMGTYTGKMLESLF